MDVALRHAELDVWTRQFKRWQPQHPEPIALAPELEQEAAAVLGERPKPLKFGELTEESFVSGGKAVFWTDGVEPIGDNPLRDLPTAPADARAAHVRVVRQQYDCPLRGKGRFRVDFLLYDLLGIDMTKMPNAALETLRLPTRVVLPFVVMILLSLITPRVDRERLDRFYVKMKTPVQPDPEADQRELALSYEDPSRFNKKRLFPFLGLEFQRPKFTDIAGFVVCFLICFGLIWLTVWLAKLGS